MASNPKSGGRKSRNDSPAPKLSPKAPAKVGVATVPTQKQLSPEKQEEKFFPVLSSACLHYLFFAVFVIVACFVTVGWGPRGFTVKLGSKMHLVVFRSLFETWAQEREFLIFDLCALSLSALCLYHSLRKAKHFTLYLSIFFGGALIDLTIRKIPQLASFWQAQNWLELLDYSEPAYILFGMYFVFQYPAIQLAQNMHLDLFGEASAAALLATMIYHPYDIVGAKYVWWMWHRDDPLMVPSELGVPVASTFWTMAYTGALAATLRWVVASPRFEKWSATSRAMLIAPIASLGLMQVPFTFFYQPLVLGLGVSEHRTLALFKIICLALVLRGLCFRGSKRFKKKIGVQNIVLLLVPLVCFAALFLVTTYFDPGQVERHGLFQTYGNCTIRESAYFGWKERAKFNCKESSGRNAELWDFRCVKKTPKKGDKWYTVCPKAFPDGWREVFTKHSAFGVGSVVVAYLLEAA